jgi:hypothetical protein
MQLYIIFINPQNAYKTIFTLHRKGNRALGIVVHSTENDIRLHHVLFDHALHY